ncbi:MAG TPA: TrkH family potassium uptake protein [Firmicutes bacterium]|nr:TrkH family potassium uptake protein [Bacillota bacterium]
MSRFRIFYLLGIMLLFLALMMLAASFWSLGEQGPDRMSFLKAILVTAGTGFFLFKLFSGARRKELSLVENFTLVALAWFVAGLFGALPFYFFGLFNGSFIDAYFEAISGFTTTGATLIDNVESIPRGLLLWRALTQWLGGMGIIVLFLAILPRFGFRSMTMFKAELPGPIAERLVPRVVETARWLWLIYVALTLSEMILLMICGLSFYDALTHSFTTMPTGGFSTYTASIAAFNNPAAEIVIIIFMFLAGANFVLYFRLIRGDLSVYRNPELRFYAAVTALAVILITANIYNLYEEELFTALRLAAFQVVSVLTTTGYATANFDAWHNFSRVMLLGLMFIGACGGSTGGSIKQIRIMLMLKFSIRELSNLVHPSAISSVKLGDQNLSEEVLRPIMGFGFLYFILTAAATLILNGFGLDFETSLSAVAATIGNVGPGLAGVGPLHTYQIIPPLGRVLLSIMMVVGRLEVYTVLVIFLPESRRLWHSILAAK